MGKKQRLGTPVLKRLPLYLRVLSALLKEGETYASGAVVARYLNLDPIVVRKDLAQTGVRGKPRVGFPIARLISAIEELLGWNTEMIAVLAGVGKLGAALLGYAGFREAGLCISAGFDAAPEACRARLDGLPVYPVAEMQSRIPELGASIGILTVPADQAQCVAEQMVEAGIQGIWNFTPAELDLPENIIVKRENLAISLAVLSHRLREQLRDSAIENPTRKILHATP